MKMNEKKLGNKGFSLVELIIVMAIMAILLGIVGTRVIPYLNRAREAKDEQLLNAFSTAAVTAYSTRAEDVTNPVSISSSELFTAPTGTTAKDKIITDIRELTGYTTLDLVTGECSSARGKAISGVSIEINPSTGKVIVTATSAKGNFVIESIIGTTTTT